MFKEFISDKLLTQGKLRWFLLINSIFTTMLELAGLVIFLPLLRILTAEDDTNINVLFFRTLNFSQTYNRESIVIALTLTVILVIVLKNLFLHLLNRAKHSTLLNIYSQISLKLYNYYFHLGFCYIKENSPSAITHNVNSVAYAYVFGFLNPLFTLVSQLLLAFSMVVALFFINSYVALAQLVILLPLILVYHNRVAAEIKQAGINENRYKKEQWKLSMETFRGYPDILVGGAFEKLEQLFKEGAKRISQSRLAVENIRSMSNRVLETGVAVVFSIFILVFVFFSSQQSGEVINGLTFTMLLFAGATIKLLPSVRNASSQLSTIRNYQYTIDIVNIPNHISHQQPGDEKQGVINTKNKDGVPLIEIKNLCYSFKNGDDLLDSISLIIESGKKIGIKGVTGAGKSTLIYLLLGLYTPKKGEILINGEELTYLNREKWHHSIGFISQETFLLDTTLAENITLTRHPDKERLKRAIKMASLEGFVNSLPSGVQTPIGEGATRLSGGERQRVAIARAFYKQAEILIMDEPTSALDPVTEADIASVLDNFASFGYKTAVIVSHSNTILARCDEVIEIKQGCR